MRKTMAISAVIAFSTQALAGGSNGSGSNANGVNYSSISQIGVNNVAAVAQGSQVFGSVVDLSHLQSFNNGSVTLASDSFVVGSIVNSGNNGGTATMTTTNSGNVTISNSALAKSSTIVEPVSGP